MKDNARSASDHVLQRDYHTYGLFSPLPRLKRLDHPATNHLETWYIPCRGNEM